MRGSIKNIIVSIGIIVIIIVGMYYFSGMGKKIMQINKRELNITSTLEKIQCQDKMEIEIFSDEEKIELKEIIGLKYVNSIIIDGEDIGYYGETMFKDIKLNKYMKKGRHQLEINYNLSEVTQYQETIEKVKELTWIKSNSKNITVRINGLEEEKLEKTVDKSKEEQSKKIIKIGGCLTIILYVAYFIIKGEKVKTKTYRREWEEVLPPVLAEAVIDGKIGIKELIMTTIVDLATRENIEIIDNETIKLLSRSGLEPYEEEIVDILFGKENDTIQFKDMKEIFRKDNQKTSKIYNQIVKIKEMIRQTLEKRKIFSKGKKEALGVIKNISIIAIETILLVILNIENGIIVLIMICTILLLVALKLEKDTVRNSFLFHNSKLDREDRIIRLVSWLIAFSTVSLLFINMQEIPNRIIIFLIISLLLILITRTSICTYTNYGKEELKKVMELKNYIKEYSLMKERDLDNTIIWDKYLAYSIAFGISNKVTDKVYAEWLASNLTLQILEQIVRINY